MARHLLTIAAMKCVRLYSVLAVYLALTAGSVDAQVAALKEVSVAVPKGDTLVLHIPSDWHSSVSRPEAPAPTVQLDTKDDSLSFLFTFLVDKDQRFSTKEAVERQVIGTSQMYVAGSVEKQLKLTPIATKNGHGCYASFSDADLVNVPAPGKGQFKYVVSGMLVIGKQSAVFTLLSNDKNSAAYKQAFQLLADGISVQ